MIDAPGFYQIAAEDYHKDPCPAPSLSASLALPLLNRSPRHAWWRHPRLNPAWREMGKRRDMEIGTAAHAMLLEAGRPLAVIDVESYRSKAAQAERDEAIAAGKTPILASDYETALAMIEVAGHKLDMELPGWSSGEAEVVMAWREGNAWCRSMVDLLSPDRGLVLDYKTTGMSAEPVTASRTLFNMAYHFKAAFYERGLDVLDPDGRGRRQFLFLFQETEEPYECSLIEPDAAAMTIARKQITAAIEIWQRCMADDVWPGYPSGVYRAQLPSWMEARWLEREDADPALTGALSPGEAQPVPSNATMQMGDWTP